MTPNGIVTLLSDFGLVDGYVAAMKGVVLRLCPDARLVDVSHLIARHDVVAGSFVLASAAEHFPSGTVHLAVVDPGVGGERAAVAVRTDRAWLVGPDNGLLSGAATPVRAVVRIDGVAGYARDPSATFHGRDLFAPAAAHLAAGGAMEDLGPALDGLAPSPAMPPVERREGALVGRVIHVDHFGNAITNVGSSELPGPAGELVVEAGSARILGLSRTYAEASAPGAPCALVGSAGLLEIALREGSAAEALGLRRGSEVTCRPRLGLAGQGEDE